MSPQVSAWLKVVVVVDGPMVYTAVFNVGSASGWIVIPGPKYYTAEPKCDRVITNRWIP
jgi:hypothetical protein